MINFIIEKAPYQNLNYSIKDENHSISTPLFVALAQNNFLIADLLIEKGADINETVCCNLDKIKEEEVHLHENPFKYFDMSVNRDCFTLDYSCSIISNVIQFLCETESLNPKNIEYLTKHKFDVKSIRPGLVKQLERHNKHEYAKLISELINEDDLD
ncbi:hypothetical protein BCR32DRAFT_325429 [Anaeromyces robustus]|uniref:Uncharacterized protein n=1 Tax=Anaeromyces robustus TaxID=1754192 RepID=A0A1Y1XI90_9FUNG|nr:hypothetical protein BCR32DRAFT_325429 [Anaeromyces robustus]|eukprot:ORX85478.1 hypothetical protein BCR32DRAFT_325429 [Anaeromyces robustus]